MSRVEDLIRVAAAEGVLPGDVAAPEQDTRPWPVVLLTGLGAWLAAIPLLGAIGLMLGGLLSRGVGPYIIGVLLLAAAVLVLRSRNLPLFVEQLAVPALLVGGGALGIGVFRDLPAQAGGLVLAIVALAIALAIDRAWLRVLLGATVAVLLAVACTPEHWRWFGGRGDTSLWVAWHLVAALTLGAAFAQAEAFSHGRAARTGAALEAIVGGMLLSVLGGLALGSGMTFLAGASIGEFGGLVTRTTPTETFVLPRVGSAGFAVLASVWIARNWPAVRRLWCAATAAVLVALAWFMPMLGAVLLILAVCVVLKRWLIAAAAATAAVWIIGAFYYLLDWPLATKAMVLVATGALLLLLVWLALREVTGVRDTSQPRPASLSSRGKVGIAVTLLAVLSVANWFIWQKEQIIAHGEPVFVALAPVDPRSLMQGDYMRLNFQMPSDVREHDPHSLKRPLAVARRDARGIATLVRLDDGSPRGADEILIELTSKNGRWVLVTDAWFFKEGEAQRWSPAKYGEFRVDSNGRALLVGLRDQQLNRL
jgi:uncharacterized membrane-anchored protein